MPQSHALLKPAQQRIAYIPTPTCTEGGCSSFGVTEWSYQETPAASNTWNSIAWSPDLGLFAAVSHSTNRVNTSPDGLNWTNRTPAANNQWYSICWATALGLFVAVANTGTNNRVMTSPDGITWTARNAAAESNWRSVCWSPELALLVAVSASGTGNRVMTSPDGINWTIRTSAADRAWSSVCWSARRSLFVAVSTDGASASDKIMTSPDGVTWTSRTAPLAQWNEVCWSPNLRLFVAVGYNGVGGAGTIITSSNGITWTSQTAPEGNTSWQSVCWASEMCLFVAVANGAETDRVMTSPDGITWTVRAGVQSDWLSICWSPELCMFAAVANGGGENERIMINRPAYFNQVNAAAEDTQMSSIADDSGRDVTDFATVSSTGVLAPGSHGANDEYSVALQFDDDIPPQGATVTKAKLILYSIATYEATSVVLYVSAHDADTPAALNTTSGDLNTTARPRTTAYSTVDVSFLEEADLITVDITTVIQELLDRPGWTATRIVLLIDTHEDTDVSEWQEFADYATDSANAARLRIDTE